MEDLVGKVYDYAIAVEKGEQPLPFFAEYPTFVWGVDSYDSDGDCKSPADREWHALDFRNRLTQADLAIRHQRSESQERAVEEARKRFRKLEPAHFIQKIRDIGPPTTRVYVVSATDLMTVQRAAYLTAVRSVGFVLQDDQKVMPEVFADAFNNLREYAVVTHLTQSECGTPRPRLAGTRGFRDGIVPTITGKLRKVSGY